MDRLVILDEKEIRRLVGKNPRKTLLLSSLTSAVISVDAFLFGLDLTLFVSELIVYGLLFITAIIAAIDVIVGMIYLKKKRLMWMQIFEQQIEQKPKISELKEQVFPAGKNQSKIPKVTVKINLKGIFLFILLIAAAAIVYYLMIGGL